MSTGDFAVLACCRSFDRLPDMVRGLPYYCKAFGAVLAMAVALICPMAGYLMLPSYQAAVYRQRIERVERDSYFGAI